MGFKISWVGVQGATKDRILERLGVRDTGDADAFYSAELSGADLPNGWFILWAKDFDFASPERLASLSVDCRVVACQVHEGTMVSRALSYDNGRELWRITHDFNRDPRDLSMSGSPPAGFEFIRRRLIQRQDTEPQDERFPVDYIFEIPVEIAAAEVCGFRHNHARFDWGEPRFTGLEPVEAHAAGGAVTGA